MSTLVVEIPVRTVSVTNNRGHWSKHSPLAQEQRFWAKQLVGREEMPPLPVIVTMTRLHPPRNRIKDREDNLNASMKSVRDGIADAYDVDDSDPRYTWRVEQEVAEEFSVRISIEPRG